MTSIKEVLNTSTAAAPQIDFDKYVAVIYVECINGNPNGDPSADNMPRINPYTGEGEITDVCIKRHFRNFFLSRGYELFIEAGVALADKKKGILGEEEIVTEEAAAMLAELPDDTFAEEAEEAPTAKAKPKKAKAKKAAPPMTAERRDEVHRKFCEKFIDVRMFGAVLSANAQAALKAPNISGCVSVSFANTLDEVATTDYQIARVTVENDRTAEGGHNQTFGRKGLVRFGLYRFTVTIDRAQADKNGFTEADFALLKQAILTLFQYNQSASRGNQIGVVGYYAFRCTAEGVANIATVSLLKRVRARRKPEVVTARSADDYVFEVADRELPMGVVYEGVRTPVALPDSEFRAA